MSPVGGSRHYDGGGLGHEGGWGCPSCGADNQGPIAQGCTACGAGRPGRHVGTQAPPPPPPAPEPPPAEGPEQLGIFDRWALGHPKATLEDAFVAGYLAGMKEGAATAERAQKAQTQPTTFSPEHLINRTMVAALALFRDQVLAAWPPETMTGEWLTADQVSALIHQIQQGIHAHEEPAHA